MIKETGYRTKKRKERKMKKLKKRKSIKVPIGYELVIQGLFHGQFSRGLSPA